MDVIHWSNDPDEHPPSDIAERDNEPDTVNSRPCSSRVPPNEDVDMGVVPFICSARNFGDTKMLLLVTMATSPLVLHNRPGSRNLALSYCFQMYMYIYIYI